MVVAIVLMHIQSCKGIMLIGDLDKNTVINVNVTDGEKSVQINSEVLELSEEDYNFCKKASTQFHFESFVVVDLMKEGDKVINFLSARVICILTALKDERPYSWNNVKILRLKLLEHGDCHIILSNSDMDTFNRRKEYRLWLGYDGLCKFGDSQVSKSVMVKDVSCSGVGIIISDELAELVEVGKPVVIQFYDSVYSEAAKEYKNKLYTLNAKIVRYIAMNNNRVLVGCRLIERLDVLEKMIYEKQRIKMTVNHAIKKYNQAMIAKQLADTYKGKEDFKVQAQQRIFIKQV